MDKPISLRAVPRIMLALSLLTIAACERYTPRSSAVEDALEGASFGVPERSADAPRPVVNAPRATTSATRPELYLGSRSFGDGTPPAAERVADGVQINFDGAEIREVVKVVLGDILGATYTIDPGITGQVVLSSSGPLSENQLLSVLETALQMQGAALSRSAGGTYAITLRDLAQGRATVASLGGKTPPSAGPGTGVTIVPLRFIGAEAASQLIQPLLSRPDQIRIDEVRNLLLFVGGSAERQTVLDTLNDIDVDWMAGRSVGIFPLDMATPEAVIPELEALVMPLSGVSRPSETMRFLPMARLNAVLVIASQPEQVVEVERWIDRLDRGNSVGVQFYVYQLQHVPAEEMADILTESFSEIAPADLDAPAALDTVFSDGADALPLGVDAAAPADAPIANGGGVARRPVGAALLRNVKIVPNKLGNTLLIRATAQAYEMIEATIRRLDTAPLQVLVEATIAEVVLNDTLRYGVQYFLNTGSVKAGFNTTTPSGGVIDPSLLSPLARLPGFNFVLTPGSSNITIDALARVTDVKVLSSPSIVVQDNSEAVLNVGAEVPITTRSAVSVDDPNAPVVNNIEYRDTGVILEVRPRISSNEIVALEVSQEVSRVSTETSTADNLTPTISQRKITSRINIQSGQTVVLGGLIQDSETRARDKVPVLGDVPVLGNLFRNNNNSVQRTELIVFLTPRIMRNAEDARDLSEELRARMRAVRPLSRPIGAPAQGTTAPNSDVRTPEPRPLSAPAPAPSASLPKEPVVTSPTAQAAKTLLAAPVMAAEEPAPPAIIAEDASPVGDAAPVGSTPVPTGPVLATAASVHDIRPRPEEEAEILRREMRIAELTYIPHEAAQTASHHALVPKPRPWSGNVFIPKKRRGAGA